MSLSLSVDKKTNLSLWTTKLDHFVENVRVRGFFLVWFFFIAFGLNMDIYWVSLLYVKYIAYVCVCLCVCVCVCVCACVGSKSHNKSTHLYRFWSYDAGAWYSSINHQYNPTELNEFRSNVSYLDFRLKYSKISHQIVTRSFIGY